MPHDGRNTMERLADERYIRLTTFRRSGDPVHTAVWHIVVDDALIVHTGDQTGKAKRLRANGTAEVAPSDARGRVTGNAVRMTGETWNGEDPGRIEAAFRDKYGWQYRAVGLTSGLRRNKIGNPTYFRFEFDDEPRSGNGSGPETAPTSDEGNEGNDGKGQR